MVRHSFNHILLASHGTQGAQAAERAALSICAAGGSLCHLLVVPQFWLGMTGDDWLNNGHTRDQFRQYLETELGKEINAHCNRVAALARQYSLDYREHIVMGNPEQILLKASESESFDLIVAGSPRPKRLKGLRSRMITEQIVRILPVPLLIAPFPQ